MGELHTTKNILHSSVGWILLFDGSNKGRWSTKGELLVFRDCDEFGETRLGVLGIIFVTNNDVKELRRLAVKPFGHEAMWGRLRDLMQQRFCEIDPLAQNFLPHVMRTMLQMAYDGASVNHALHRYVSCSDAHLHWPQVMPWWSKHFRD